MSSRVRASRLHIVGCLAVAALAGTAVSAHAQGLGLGIAPTGSWIRWDDDLGIEDGALYGAEAAVEFGRYVRLKAGLMRGSSLDTRFGELGYAVGENQVDATLGAVDVLLRLGSAPLAPILAGGGGVVRFQPDGRDATDHVFAEWGGGLGLRLGNRVEGRLLVHDVRMRVDRALLARGDDAVTDPGADDLRGNLVATLGVGLRVGSRPSPKADVLDRGFDDALHGGTDAFMVPLEFYGGVLRFDEALAIEDLVRVGARAGVDLGAYFGLHGSYWHGVRDGLDAFEDVQGWSGEARFDLGRAGLSPFLLVGYGQILFDDAFVNDSGVPVPDQNAVMVGAGLAVPLWDRLRLTATFLDHITATGELEDASRPSDLRHNLSLDAGLSALLFGSRAERPPTPIAVREPPEGVRTPADTVTAPPALAAADTAAARTPAPALEPPDTVRVATPIAPPASPPAVEPEAATPPSTPTPAPAEAVTSYQSDRVVTLPVPAVGELYVRYGPPADRAGWGAGTPPPAAVAGSAATPALDSAAIAAFVRAELARWARADTAAAPAGVQTQAPPGALVAPAAQPGVAATPAGDSAGPPSVGLPVAPAGEDERLALLQEQVRELTRIVREDIAREPRTEAPVTVVAPPPAAAVERGTTTVGRTPPTAAVRSRSSLVRSVEGRVGTATIRDGRIGVGAAVDVSFRGPGPAVLRPFVGVEVSRSSVRTTLGESSVFGTVRNVGGSVGTYIDIGEYGDFQPSLSVALTGVGGSVSGDTEQDDELMDRIYEGFRLGADIGAHVAWQPPRGQWLVAAAVSRLMAGSRSRWAVDGGVRLPLGTTAPVGAGIVPARDGGPALPEPVVVDTVGPDTVRVDTMRVDTVPAPATDSATMRDRAELLSRLEAIEQAVTREADSRQVAADRARTRDLLRRELEALVGVLPEVLSVRSSDRGLVVILGGGMFSVGSASLRAGARTAIERIGTLLRAVPDSDLLVEGHTDATGSEGANLQLSARRAEAVRSALIRTGLVPARISIAGIGETSPLADNETAEGRARNRRVEIVLLGWPTAPRGPQRDG